MGWVHHQIRSWCCRRGVYQARSRPSGVALSFRCGYPTGGAGWVSAGFLDQGPGMLDLLQATQARLAAGGIRAQCDRSYPDGGFRGAGGCRSGDAWVGGPLTAREVDILRLLATKMTVPEIAAILYVTPNTIRSHVKHIYGKLEVHRCFSAVQKRAGNRFDLTGRESG